MSVNHNQDKFGPMFEAMASELGFNIAHSECECGNLACGYSDASTTIAFAGFLMAFMALDNRGVRLLSPEHIPGFTKEKVRVSKES